MNRLLDAYAAAFQRWMPTPMSIAVLLTFLTAGLGLMFSGPSEVLGVWVEGLWNPGLIRFGFQAMFMLVLGHVLALSPPVLGLLARFVRWILAQPAWAAPKLALLAMGLGWLNWGLGIVGGAILVRGVMQATRDVPGRKSGVLGAAGYAGMLVWHGGLSGSAPLKVAELGHLQDLAGEAAWGATLMDTIGLRETIFSSWSLILTFSVATATVFVFYLLGRGMSFEFVEEDGTVDAVEQEGLTSADRGPLLPWILGIAAVAGAVWWALASGDLSALKFITPDWINLVLLALSLLAHGSIASLLRALDEAIGGASGILIQFPIYFGIMGIVTGTGLGEALSGALVGATSPGLLPLALFTSSAVLNVFVPSGGGQWAVQGPLVLESCLSLGVPVERGIMAMAFGDQLTNMLQPFWALPLLGITGLKARDILPYTLLVMVVAGAVMVLGMLL